MNITIITVSDTIDVFISPLFMTSHFLVVPGVGGCPQYVICILLEVWTYVTNLAALGNHIINS